MKIIVNEKEGTYTFFPVENNETRTLVKMVRRLKPGQVLGYDGRIDEPDGSVCLRLFAGGRQARKTIRMGKTKMTHPTIVGGRLLLLRGSEDEDKGLIFQIRELFVATPGLSFVRTETIDGKVCLVLSTGIKCKLCEMPICCGRGVLTQICDSCSEKCNHDFEKSIALLESGELGIGQRCSICFIEKPKDGNEPDLSARVQQAMIERDLGCKIITNDEDLVKSIKRVFEK